MIPNKTKHAVDLYVSAGLAPTPFIRAVLEDNLYGALCHATPGERDNLLNTVSYVANTVPMQMRMHHTHIKRHIAKQANLRAQEGLNNAAR